MLFFIIGICLLVGTTYDAHASQIQDFKTLIAKIETHPKIDAVKQGYLKKSSMAETQSFLKDPTITFSAVNVPSSSLRFDQTPMSSKQIAISQNIPITTRLGYFSEQADYLMRAGQSQIKYQAASARAQLWTASARLESLNKQATIVQDSLTWMDQVEKSTQRLYETGKTNQITLLEIKIRNAELESQSASIASEISNIESLIGYLTTLNTPTSVQNVPWQLLDSKQKDGLKDKSDYLEHSLVEELNAAKSKLAGEKLSAVPDLSVGVAYSFRDDLDKVGDFVSASIGLSIPIWGSSQNKERIARSELNEKNAVLSNYKLEKTKQLYFLGQQILSTQKELNLTKESIQFAESERQLAGKNYSLGRVSVFELLEIELKLRQKKTKKEILLDTLRATTIQSLLLKGDNLNV